MTIQDVLAGLQQTPQQPTAVNPSLIPAAQALRQVPTGPNPMAVQPPQGRGLPMPTSPGALPPRHDASIEGLMQGAPGGSRPNGGLPSLIQSLGLNNANSGTDEQVSSDNSNEQKGE